MKAYYFQPTKKIMFDKMWGSSSPLDTEPRAPESNPFRTLRHV